MSKGDDERSRVRDIILARRARFLGVALGAAGLVVSTEGCDEPKVCLSIEPVTNSVPQVCLEAPPIDEDAGSTADAGSDEPADAGGESAGAADAGTAVKGSREDAGAPRPQPTVKPRPRPGPCLSPPHPKVCLSRPMPKPGDKKRDDI